jgi:CTP synthase (UTP-ammonia lyase)
VPSTIAYRAYGKDQTSEEFRCNYGLNPAYHKDFAASALVVAGIDLDGEYRIVELPDHRFFMATLFLPQLSSTLAVPHPLIVAYVKAALRGKE